MAAMRLCCNYMETACVGRSSLGFEAGIAAGPRGDQSIQQWVARVDAGRRASDYVQSSVPMIEDPTGRGPTALHQSVTDLDLLCRRFAELWG